MVDERKIAPAWIEYVLRNPVLEELGFRDG
jgi:hypothetical protein